MSLSTDDFSALYPLLHCLVTLSKKKLTELIEDTFNREGSLYLASNENRAFSLLNNLKDINCDNVRKCVMLSIIFWTIYSFDTETPFLDLDVSITNDIVSQLICLSKVCSNVHDFNNRNQFLTAKLLKGYRYHKHRKLFLNSTTDTQS